MSSTLTDAQSQAIDSHHRLVAAHPRDAATRARLGVALRDAGRLSAARREFLEAVRLDPNLAVAWHGLSLVATELGRGAEAAEALGRRYQLEPSPRAGSDWLYARLHTGEGAEGLAEGHGEWGRRWGERIQNGKSQIQDGRFKIEEPPPRPSPGIPGEGVRIGYVSGDFREHAQMRFILPLLLGHDRSRFRVYCYSDVRRPDDVTRRVRSCADVWRETAGLDDLALAQLIRADQIDVLVELTGHMAGSRLAMFTHRPAKVQVAWPGYPFSTGLPAIDYLIGDDDREPPGVERFYSEKLIRLAGGSQVIDFSEGLPEPGETLPSERAEHVTFGVSNRLGKVTPEMVRVWARLLGEVRRSTLRLIVASTDPEDAAAVRRLLAAGGIAPHRVELVRRAAGPPYWDFYRDVDICLDTFPYNGHTTTFDALWMGVPIVTLAGETRVSREGLAILRPLGLDDLAATTEEQYIAAAAKLAADIDRRRALRANLRQRLGESRFCDHPGFARRFESALAAAVASSPVPITSAPAAAFLSPAP